ncbi:uncharacterized protein LOC126586632 [Malus sylvestris]|nr:uncharacterized protein LOC126586632 [Malus sylvestris]
MEEYLRYMKTLRFQMNDAEDQAAKVSVEEQMQLTTTQTLENDLNSAISETKRLLEEQMKNSKGQVCLLILEKLRKIASLESDSSSLTLTKQAIEQVNLRENDFKPELREMDIKRLEEEFNALLSDKAGETEYLKTLQDQIVKLKGISHVVKCACGVEYKVELDICA